jgi:hypothetical protein
MHHRIESRDSLASGRDAIAVREDRRVVIVAMRPSAFERSCVESLGADGHKVVVVHRASEIGSASSALFDHGIFGFDLEDGSAIVLAARLRAEGRLTSFEVVHPEDERRDIRWRRSDEAEAHS